MLSAQVNLDLKMCREMALENSKQMAIALKQKEKAVFEKKSYRADFLPKLLASGTGFYNREKYSYKLKGGYLPTFKPGAGGKLEENLMIDPETMKPVIGADGRPVFNEYAYLPDIGIELGMRGVYMAGLQLQQPVYMGGKVRAAHQMAKAGEVIAGENIRLSRSEIIVETDEAYWQVMRVQEQAVAARKYREVLESLVRNLKNAQEIGTATLNDVLKARVKYDDAGLMVQKAENGLVLSRMNLCRLVGLELQTAVNIRDSLSDTVSPELWTLEGSVEQRPDYNMLAGDVDLKARQVELARSDFLPQLGVAAGYGYGGGLTLNGEGDANASFNALASLQIPLFHWGEGRNKIRAAKMDQEISRLNLEKSADMMQLEIAAARFNLKDAVARIEMSRDALLQAKANLRISADQYQVGMETLTNLLEAQAQWQESWSRWIDAKAMLHLCASKYLKAIGVEVRQ